MKLRTRVLATLLVTALTLAGCGNAAKHGDADTSTSSSSESKGSDQLIIGAETDVVTLDPGRCYETYANTLMRACYDTLFDMPTGTEEPQPLLAKDIQYSDDGLTVTVTLRDDAVFASGNPVTAKDVQFSIMRCKNLKDNPSFICDGIDSIDVVDDYTVQFNLNTPDSSFTAKLCYNALSIIDSEAAKEQGATCDEDAATTDTAKDYFDAGASLGSGPYTLESWTPDEEFVLTKNDKYYDGDVAFSKVTIKEMDDANTQMMSLKQNDIQVAMGLNQDTVGELEGADGVDVNSYATMTMGFVYMNMDESIGGPVSDPLVQQAVRLALDYKGIQDIVGDGSLTPTSYIQVGLLGALDARDTSYTDVDKAKELMKEAGYEDGFEIDFPCCTLAPEGIPLTDLAQKVASDLEKIGIKLNIVTQDWNGGYADDYRNGTLGMSLMYWSPDYIDPNAQLEFLPGGIVGLRAGWTAEMDPELAAMKEKIVAETDQDARVELLKEMQESTADSGPIIPIVQYPKYIGSSATLTGTDFSDIYRVDIRAIAYK